MSSRSGGEEAKRISNFGPGRDSKSQSTSSGMKGEGDNGFAPLETRLIEVRDASGCVKQVPALDKRWVPLMEYIEFYLPSCKTLLEDESAVLVWLELMDMYCTDLKWLLAAPHHQFWSVMIYSPGVPQTVLQTFLLGAPQWFDKQFQVYLEHETICPKYQEIYSLVFRVFMRLCTFKESKKDFISPITWASFMVDHKILDILKLQMLCCLYDSKENTVFPKMVESVMKNCPKLLTCFRNMIPVLLSKSKEMTEMLMKCIREATASNSWNLQTFEEILSFFLSTTCELYKFVKVYPPAAEVLAKFPTALIKLAMTYEPNCCKPWSKVVSHLPMLEDRVTLLRMLIIRLFRVALANPTILEATSSNDKRIDEFFETLTNCLDEKMFIRDYEKTYPFKQDINALLSRGIFIDETRIDYIANAISACFHACGEDYAVEKIVVDPLYDPNFDRQLLGACSLDVTGVELQSLVTQVKDILPELPDSYVEVVLKHYTYNAEVAINALLEGSVPTRLEKYKNESYVQPLTNSSASQAESVSEDTELEKLASKLVIKDAETEAERFYAGKRRYGFEDNSQGAIGLEEMADLKPKIKGIMAKMDEETVPQRDNNPTRGKKSVQLQTMEEKDSYLDESLLPSYHDTLEYEDEYDDTYDELGVGMTEPDNVECKPLNQKLQSKNYGDAMDEEEDEQSVNARKLNLPYEDPAIVRARMERRREEKFNHNHRRSGPPPPQQTDVVGKAKGQGQDKDVLYARRQKNINKDPGGNKKKRADFKRREF